MHIDKERERQSGYSEKRKEGTNLSSGETKEMEEREKKKVKLIEEKDEGERQKRISSWIIASSRGKGKGDVEEDHEEGNFFNLSQAGPNSHTHSDTSFFPFANPINPPDKVR